ncbi:MAG TPA: ABC transporter permease, partial [Myxococcales bacterium]|nr:ABC transporter permease [Myxococcales bacterium]
LQNTVSVNISMALRNFASVVGGIGFLLYTSASLTTVILFVIPPVALGAVFYGRKIRKYSRDVQDALASASEIAEETISGVRTVRAFSQESNESKRYGEAIDHSFELSKKRARITAVFSAVITSAGYGAIALVFWYGGHLVVKGGMSVGDLTSFVLYTLIVAVSFGTLGGLYADFMRASGAAERVFALIDRIPTIPNEQGQQLPNLKGEVTLKDIDFRYPSRPDIPVLKGISLSIKPGEVVALVGPSGGGKSTIAALISRLYDPDKGDVIFDEHNVKELDPTWLRRQIGVVPQEPILFSTTIADNIRYGREDASEEELIAAAKAANAHDFIMTFPDGYQTTVGERGVQLSGGQKQRVAIARAVLKDPRVLLLDEATSALDAESEFLVKEALDRLMEGRTTLVIAHRLSTVKDATRVIVLDQGAVAESGSHDELFQEDGLYRRLVERQMVD